MNAVLAILIVIATFFFMEFMAWFTHKYVMHGFMWYFHKDHHQKEPGFFEKNDVFFLIFAVPSWLFTMFGMMHGYDWKLFVGIGIFIYGVCYFLVHDVLIHQRFKWFRGIKNPYFNALRKGHNAHHKHKGKEDGESFGMLVVPWGYFKEAYERHRNKRAKAA
ncbi:sterol desaturase family protein [Salibacter sp.]|jgi:beta-carotene 3-hydroxylase|uniref:sterol desaturase family protein n=1 Tax=Salibacter sp. TaxID=2010995 RepID=UPI002870AB5D|nr:sterol desaturase family protein [Salibacter sp.]MDR9397475.1 sterol desaturase family protein [Salibacter sp.]MDR9486709.1 sterol desaturase family protein [Salibacter sp.]